MATKLCGNVSFTLSFAAFKIDLHFNNFAKYYS